jgi:predicted nucleic acid-binding protein
MIVVDANVIAYAVIPGAKTALALSAIEADAEWVAPPLWKSELRKILPLGRARGRDPLHVRGRRDPSLARSRVRC